MKNRIMMRLANDQYKAHFNHEEVTNDVDGSLKDHRDLLEDDQNCIEKIMDVADMDSSNTGDCECCLCEPGKPCESDKLLYGENTCCDDDCCDNECKDDEVKAACADTHINCIAARIAKQTLEK